jgi:hypothetical protein
MNRGAVPRGRLNPFGRHADLAFALAVVAVAPLSLSEESTSPLTTSRSEYRGNQGTPARPSGRHWHVDQTVRVVGDGGGGDGAKSDMRSTSHVDYSTHAHDDVCAGMDVARPARHVPPRAPYAVDV